MYYFELFNIPIQLKVDKERLRQKYIELSRKYHPDYKTLPGADEQQKAQEASVLLNKAYQTLQSRDETIRYVLQEKGMMADEKTYQLPPDFQMQMKELSEELSEATLQDDVNLKGQILHQLADIEKVIYEPVQHIVEHYREGVTTRKELLQVKDYYFKKKYIHRLMQQIAQKS